MKFEVSAWIDEADSYKNPPSLMENYNTLKQAKKAAERAANRFDYVEIVLNEYDEQGSLDEGTFIDCIVRL